MRVGLDLGLGLGLVLGLGLGLGLGLVLGLGLDLGLGLGLGLGLDLGLVLELVLGLGLGLVNLLTPARIDPLREPPAPHNHTTTQPPNHNPRPTSRPYKTSNIANHRALSACPTP
ncbi:hypothetical protein EA187_19595 [Lujinxingia sediminis]|uniref:Uncharacterized protein n=1 Tax=Lujinxingia sediminis TaxID=2480984 RepID=A0ABY0CN82_9DELT|nr:hypothetical protein EA187_19595 [Lujinxingia sediminis]